MQEGTATAPLGAFPDDTLLAGRYRLEELVGHGGFARVFLARDELLGRRVAIKQFSLRAADSAEHARMVSETRLLASLAHPHLVTLFDADLEADPPYLVMEFIDGPTLREAITLRGAFAPADAGRLTSDLAAAVQVIHGRGIVHRDIKPANVLLRPSHIDGEPATATLADFGIASLVDGTRLTAAGMLVGTAAYLSPEQVRGAAPALPADVYSLGLVVLEALTGRTAFAGSTPNEALAARLTRTPELPDDLSPGWRALLTAMLSIDPARRPTAAEVADAAGALAGDPEAGPRSPRGAVPVPTADPPTRILTPTTGGPAQIATPAPVGTSGEPTPEAPVAPPAGSPRRKPKRIVVPALLAAVALAAGAVGVPLALSAAGPATPEPTLPALPDPIGTHMSELWEQVSE